VRPTQASESHQGSFSGVQQSGHDEIKALHPKHMTQWPERMGFSKEEHATFL